MSKKITRKIKSNNNRDVEPLLPLNDKQKEYIEAIYYNPVIIATGVLGSSKTYIPSVIASDLLMSKQIDKVIIARPNEGKGRSIGFLPGDLNEKLSAWTAPIVDTMKQRLGEGHYEAYLDNGKIEMLALEHCKGRSWDDCFVIIDEAEDLDVSVAKTLVTRQGMNTTMVITGDIAQQDLKSYSGLQFLIDVSKKYDLPVATVNFDDWSYCVRSSEARMWGEAFEKYAKD